MLKDIIERTKRKFKEKESSKVERTHEYSVDFLFLGCYDQKVCEDNGIPYTYKHNECFLLDSKYVPNQVTCITGGHDDCGKPFICYQKSESDLEIFSYKYYVTINGIIYEIDLKLNELQFENKDTVTLEEIAEHVNNKNQIAKANARNSAYEKFELELSN